MKFYLGVTDPGWFKFLAERNNEDVNFWQPGGITNFRVISPGEPFLFKLKNPYNAIAGIGFFSSFSILPLEVAWNIFEERNGATSLIQFRQKISGLRSHANSLSINPNIGCVVLTDPIFFRQEDWIKSPEDWGRSIVQGKSYDTKTITGLNLWEQIEKVLVKYSLLNRNIEKASQLQLFPPPDSMEFTRKYLTKVRIGQGAFRVQLTDAYLRRCSVSGEKTLPVLEAAHIKPFAESGPSLISNGILLRSDLHKLFDSGYITITKDRKVEVSQKIREEYQNGREYYRYHGKKLLVLPDRISDYPDPAFIDYHNTTIFKG
jgi:putative restriction endonuclease